MATLISTTVTSADLNSTSEEITETNETSDSVVENAEKVNTDIESSTKFRGSENSSAIPTLHNIYLNKQEVLVEQAVKSATTTKSKISRSLYTKFHRKSLNSTAVSKLKGKFETEEEPKKSVVKATTGGKPDPPQKPRNGVPEKVIEPPHTKPEDTNTSPVSKIETNTTTKLPNTELKEEDVEELKKKYSPASFGYPKSPTDSKTQKKVQFSPEATTRIPVPAPRNSVKRNSLTPRSPSPDVEIAQVQVKIVGPEKPAITYIKPTEGNHKKDENENNVKKPAENVVDNSPDEIDFADPEEKHFVVRASSSEDSVVQVESSLSEFIMDKPKEKKRSSSFRRILSGNFFGKEKKKGKKNESVVENAQNESSSFNRGAPHRHTTAGNYSAKRQPNLQKDPFAGKVQKEVPTRNADIEERFAQMHINKFNDIKNNFSHPKPWTNPHAEDYVCMDIKNDLRRTLEEPHFSSYLNSSNVNKYIDTSSSSSTSDSIKRNNTYENALIAQAELQQRQNQNTRRSNSFRSSLPVSREHSNLPRPIRNHRTYSESPERFTATPPRAQETYQNLQLVKPKALIPINSERPLPNPFQLGKNSERPGVSKDRTIDRNLNVGDTKTSPNKTELCNSRPFVDDTYGTVFDAIAITPKYNQKPSPTTEHLRNRSLSPSYRRSNTSSPRSPSLEGSKLKLPPNREKIDLQPRIKSPIPPSKVSTDKIIATELLKQRSSPSPTKKQQRNSPSHQNLDIIDYPESLDSRLRNGHIDAKVTPIERRAFSPTQEVFDAPKTVTNKPPISPKKPFPDQYLEAGEWHRKQKEIDQFPSIPMQTSAPPVTTDVMVHKETPIQTLERMKPLNYASHTPSPVSSHYGHVYPQERSTTPINTRRLSSSSLQLSPEKQEMRQNVEAFYWKELKKLKEREEMEYYYQLQRYGYADDIVLPRRSRTSTPSLQRTGRRSLSLPRDTRPVKMSPGDVPRQPETIPEDQVVLRPGRGRNEPFYGQFRQQFVRNTPERSTIGPIGMSRQPKATYENFYPQRDSQRPIFNRGSLSNQDFVDAQSPGYKKVSFGGQNNGRAWPTRNGYVQSPPQRLDKRDSGVEDEVFLPTTSVTPRELPYNKAAEGIYGTNTPRDSQRSLRKEPAVMTEKIYNHQRVISNGLMSEDLYVQRVNTQNNPTYGQFISNSPKEPLYVRSVPKQVTVSNKVCDIYGQIHDTGPPTVVPSHNYPQVQKSGVVYGQLNYNPAWGVRQTPPSSFIRGSRLTASANDMYRRYQVRDPRYRSDTVFEPVYERQPLRPQVLYKDESDSVQSSPRRPLPPVPSERVSSLGGRYQRDAVVDNRGGRGLQEYVSATGEEEWNPDGGKSSRGIAGNDSGSDRRGDNDGEVRGRSRGARREDPRRHTLGGDQQYGLMAGQGGPLSRTMDLEGQPRGYPPPSNAMLFDDDPGIMSEVETSSTGFRRGGKQRSSLPVVRTPSKTLERPLGLVFLQYRNETKRALLPNEITSIDTVKALFVRSFPKQLTMEYLDSPQVKIYIHDSSKDMFYELEDLRSHLREIRDRSVLRLFESADVSGGLPMAGIGIAGGVGHFEDPSYFSEPEFDSEYQHQHIHKSKGSAGKAAPYYMGSTASLPRGAPLLRTYSPAVGALPSDRLKTLPSGAPPKPQRAYSSGAPRQSDGPSRPTDRFAPFQRSANSLFNLPDGYMSSPERGSRGYEDPYYSQYTSRSGSITPVIDEEISDTEMLDDSYSLYGVKLPPGGPGPRAPHRSPFPPPTAVPYDTTTLRMENIERQIANLSGLVQKAITLPTHLQVPSGRENYRTGDEFDMNSSSSSTSLPDDSYLRSDSKAPKLGKSGCHKSVSFEKSVSFSDEPPDMSSPKQHSPQHSADTKPPKPAIKSSTLPRTSSQERDRLKPAPPPKPASLSPGQYDGRHIYRDLQLTPEMYNQLRGLQKKAKDLRAEVRNLRRMSQAQAHSVRETIRDTFIKIRAMLLAGGEQVWQAGMDQERMRLSREEDLYKQEMLRLENDLGDLEATVEELRGNVINRKTRVNMSDVESMALVLSKSSKTVADLKLRFPGLQDGMKAFLSTEMEKVVREEKFLKEEPERLESALRRCKKLTGTLVTLKRLASVQEQRLPCSPAANDGQLSPTLTETPPVTPTSAQHSKSSSNPRMGTLVIGGDSTNSSDSSQRPENALDALLDELQTFSKPHPSTVSTQIPQSYPEYSANEPPAIPAKGIAPPPNNHPLMSEIGRKGSMDSASFLPTQNLTVSTATGSLRRLHSYPSGSDTDNSPPIQPLQRLQVDCKTASKPPLPERNVELLQHVAGKRVPPPPPPRTSSKSPLASPTSPSLPPRSPAVGLQHIQNVQNMVEKPQSQFEMATQNLGLGTLRRNVANRSSIKDKAQTLPRNIGSNLQVLSDSDVISASNSSSCESVNSQDGSKKSTRKEELEQRHQELLKKQKALQEQYARLQQLQRGGNTLAVVPPAPDQLLKKTGSESNLLQKMGLQLATTQMTGSLTHLPNTKTQMNTEEQPASNTTTNKVYETDIL